MSAYRTVVVGADGSPTSLRAVATHAEDVLRTALGTAQEAGAVDVHSVAVVGPPAEGLMDLADREAADLVVVGNRGLDILEGRRLGSVPSDVTRRSEIDVLVVHTTG